MGVQRRQLGVALVLVTLVVMASGCYHAVVQTGRPESGVHFEKKWAHGFVGGLVPPDVVDVTQQCPNGVARVETQLSFMNQLVTAITVGIYSPMKIDVYCAAPGEDQDVTVLHVDADGRLEPGVDVPIRDGGSFYLQVTAATR